MIKLIIFAVIVLGVLGYFAYRYFRKPMVTGGQEEAGGQSVAVGQEQAGNGAQLSYG